jgi:GTPase SAR1 family protein
VQTVGAELSITPVAVPGTDVLVKLHLLDTGGHPSQHDLVHQAIGKQVHFCCIVYSVVSRQSFDDVRAWHTKLRAHAPGGHATLRGVLVATKCDLPAQRHEVRQPCKVDNVHLFCFWWVQTYDLRVAMQQTQGLAILAVQWRLIAASHSLAGRASM